MNKAIAIAIIISLATPVFSESSTSRVYLKKLRLEFDTRTKCKVNPTVVVGVINR